MIHRPRAARMPMFIAVGTMRWGLSNSRRLGCFRTHSSTIWRVPSSDRPSTTSTSIPPITGSAEKIEFRHLPMKPASLRVGMTIVTCTGALISMSLAVISTRIFYASKFMSKCLASCPASDFPASKLLPSSKLDRSHS